MVVFRSSLLVTGIALVSFSAADTFRIATWNITNYNGGRGADIQNAVYGTFQGRSFAPDAIFAQEILSETAALQFVSFLNSASGSPGDWVYFDNNVGSGNHENAFFYRSSRVINATSTLIAIGSSTTNPRDIYRYDFQIAGNSDTSFISVYNSHMKSGTTTDDQNRRQFEANAIRNNANALATGFLPVVLGDFNMRTSTEQAYQTLVGSTSNNRGRVFDPINSPGTWYQNNAARFLHTQDPSGTGGMDDRFDQILMSDAFADGVGTEYLGAFGTTYSTTTWNDTAHSYRVWGNDGSSFNSTLTTTGNQMVGASIATSLINVATPAGGHLPVFADFTYTAVPEPFSMGALALGIVALARRRRR